MEVALGWALTALAIVVGYVGFGWQGLLLAVTVIAFWLLLQLSRALRVMRSAAQAPMGHVPSAVMLHAKLAPGMRLIDVVSMTGSLGCKTRDEPETYVWRDESGAEVEIELADGRCRAWRLTRAP